MSCPYGHHTTQQSRDLNPIQPKLYYDLSEGRRIPYR